MATYNALKYTQKLEEAGFTREQAEETVKMVVETVDHNFATKHELKEMEFALKSDIQQFRSEVSNEFQKARSEVSQEFQSVRSEMAQEFQKVRYEMAQEFQKVRSEINQLESRLIIKMGAMMMASTLATITILQFLQARP